MPTQYCAYIFLFGRKKKPLPGLEPTAKGTVIAKLIHKASEITVVKGRETQNERSYQFMSIYLNICNNMQKNVSWFYTYIMTLVLCIKWLFDYLTPLLNIY